MILSLVQGTSLPNELHICFAFIRIDMLMVKEPRLLSCSPSSCLPQLLLSWDGLYDETFWRARLLPQWHLYIWSFLLLLLEYQPYSVSFSKILNFSNRWQFSSFQLLKCSCLYWFFSIFILQLSSFLQVRSWLLS